MPFTFAHVAAALPLARPLGRFAVPSALAIGTMAPDFIFFHWGVAQRGLTHTVPALFWYCLPAGVLVYLVWHFLLKRPLLALAPPGVERRLRRIVLAPVPLHAGHWLAVALSIVIGAATHLVWDGFTHAGDFGVRALPLLAAPAFSVGGYELAVHQCLQHFSSLFGMAIVAGFALLAFLRLEPAVGACPDAMRPAPRAALAAALLLGPIIVGVLAGMDALRAAPSGSVMPLELFASTAAVAAIVAGGVMVIAYAVAWQLSARRPRATSSLECP